MEKIDTNMSGGKLLVIVFAAFLLGGIGIVTLFSVFSAGTDDHIETFDVSNQFVDKVCGLSNTPKETPTVEYYNGASWTTLTGSDYTLSGNTLTVDADAMD